MDIKVIGHRGTGPTHKQASTSRRVAFPENSIGAFRKALRDGADGIEMDICVSKDNVPIVIHDEDLEKHVESAGQSLGRVGDYNVTALKQFSIGQGYTIPSLQEVFDLVVAQSAGRKAPIILNLDMKDPSSLHPTYELIEEYVRAGRLRFDQIVVGSYNWDLLRECKKLNPKLQVCPCLKTALLFGKKNVRLSDYKPLTDHYDLQGIEHLREFHKEVGCYGFDCIIDDYRAPLGQLAGELGVGLSLSTGNQRVDADSTKYDALKEIQNLSDVNVPFLIYKSDDPGRVKKAITQPHL